MYSKLRRLSETIGHVGNAWTFAGFVGWQAKLSAFGAGMLAWAATFFGAAGEGLSVTAVWVASLAAGLLVSIIVFVIAAIRAILRIQNNSSAEKLTAEKPSTDFDEFIPDLRVADSPAALKLFDGTDGDKLLPLLEAEKIIAWARRIGGNPGDEPAPLKVPGTVWRDHYFKFNPRPDGPGRINQTFIKTRSRDELVYYDVFLNSAQIRRVWPKFEQPLAASDDTSTFPAALYVPGTWMQTPMLVEHGVIHINIDMINGTNEDIYLKAINGSIAVTRVDQNDDKKALGELSSPRFAEMRRNHIDKFQGFSFTLVQDLPKRLVTELSNWDEKIHYIFDFGKLNIIVQSANHPEKTARLPLWDQAHLEKKGNKIAASRISMIRF
jgi:hypothetical protein